VDNDYKNPAPIVQLPGDTSEDFWKTSSGSEYYYSGDEVESEPAAVYEDGSEMTKGTLGSLSAGEWAWDDGNTRLVVRLATSVDPDTKGDGWVEFKDSVTDATKPFVEVDGSTFNASGSWWDGSAFVNPDLTKGQLSFEINANTAAFYRRLGTKERVTTTTMQIQLSNAASELYFVAEFQFVCKNRYLGSAYTVEVTGANIYTKSQIDVFLDGKQNIVASATSGNLASFDASGQVEDSGIATSGLADMTKAVYDTDDDGIVDKAEAVDDGTNSKTAA
jgi:hypothetical protein